MTQTNDPERSQGALRLDQSQLIFEEGFSFSGYERDFLCLNRGNGTYLDISGVSGLDSITDGRAAVFADFDNDGDLDVFLTTIQGQAHLLFRNNIGQGNNSLRLALEGTRSGRDGFSAVVRVQTSAGILTKIKAGGSGFLSQHDPRLLFGLGEEARADWIEVTWPNGKAERFEVEARAGSSWLLQEGTERAQPLTLPSAQLPDPLTRAETIALGLHIRVGESLPEIPVTTLEGASSSLRKHLKPGRRALINLWATWCLPCATEMPELERLRPQLEARGIDLIGLNVDTDPGAKIERFLKDTGVEYPTYKGGVAAIEQLYASEELIVPLTILVDETGRVTELIPGWSDESRRRFARLAGLEANR